MILKLNHLLDNARLRSTKHPCKPTHSINNRCLPIYRCFWLTSPKRILEGCYSEQDHCDTEESVVNRLWRFFGFIVAVHAYQQTALEDSILQYGGEKVSHNTQKWVENENHSKRNQQHRCVIIDVRNRGHSAATQMVPSWHKTRRFNQIRTCSPNNGNSKHSAQITVCVEAPFRRNSQAVDRPMKG